MLDVRPLVEVGNGASLKLLAAIGFLLVVASCRQAEPLPNEAVLAPDQEAVLALLHSADGVETFRVDGRHPEFGSASKNDSRRATEYFDGIWPISKAGPRLGPDFTRRLESFLRNPANFHVRGPEGIKACIFTPGVAFRLRSGSDVLEILVCFSCGDLVTYSNRGRLPLPSGDFTPGYVELSALAKVAFPDDSDIQALR